jgi:hypothetical protein
LPAIFFFYCAFVSMHCPKAKSTSDTGMYLCLQSSSLFSNERGSVDEDDLIQNHLHKI